MSMVIDYDLEVEAPASLVWEVITDTARYPEWNPFVLDCDVRLEPGGPINMKVRLGKGIQKANEIIREVNEGRGFSYSMKPPPLGALRSYRSHDIEPIDANRCRYRSHFEMHGWLQPVVKLAVGKHLHTGFGGMSHGIKDRAEMLAKARKAA